MMPSYCYKDGFKPYKRSFEKLTPQVQQIIEKLRFEEVDKTWGYLNRIARRVGVSRCFVWQIAHRLEVTKEER